jgi:murein DD-endopeptidase MepM/ murein hydrolase activator NlpD
MSENLLNFTRRKHNGLIACLALTILFFGVQIFYTQPASALTNPAKPLKLAQPISSALKRVAKKPFGIKVSPGHSPVKPERFSGYHTGVDFETTDGEKNKDVPIYAVCSGQIIVKRQASGYGGVLVEACKLNSRDVTVVYGHLKLSSISLKIGSKISAGGKIGILGKGFSRETDGERKHLHLAIHKGKTVNLPGYVQNKKDLGNWLDPAALLN